MIGRASSFCENYLPDSNNDMLENNLPGDPGAGVFPPSVLGPIFTPNPDDVGGPKPMLLRLDDSPVESTPGGGKSWLLNVPGGNDTSTPTPLPGRMVFKTPGGGWARARFSTLQLATIVLIVSDRSCDTLPVHT